LLAVRPEGAKHQWMRVPYGKLSINPVADEQLGSGMLHDRLWHKALVMASNRHFRNAPDFEH
jgi:hypothetical protein